MYASNVDMSCGIIQITGLYDYYSTVEERIKGFLITYEHKCKLMACEYPVVLFSDIAESFGHQIAKELRRLGLGEVITSRIRKNPNSGNNIVAYIWHPSNKAKNFARKLFADHMKNGGVL